MGLVADMQTRGVWEACQHYVIDLEPILVRTSRRGLPISADRHREVTAEFEAELLSLFNAMQTLVPDEVVGFRTYKTKKAIKAHGGETVRKEFKPSNQALIRYMKHRGHPVPRHWRTGKDTTQQDDLKRLARDTQDPLYALVQQYRDAQSTLKNHLKNWRPCV